MCVRVLMHFAALNTQGRKTIYCCVMWVGGILVFTANQVFVRARTFNNGLHLDSFGLSCEKDALQACFVLSIEIELKLN